MRIRSFLAALLLTFSFAPAQASVPTSVFIATGQLVVPPLLACSMGVFADGCQAAPAPLTASFARTSTFTPGGYMNTTAGTTANYMATNCGPSNNLLCRQAFNVAGNGDDGYHIGYYSTSAQMNCVGITVGTCTYDPATFGVGGVNSVLGCVYSSVGSTGGIDGSLRCGGTFLGVLNHFNLGPVGGHNCTSLVFTTPNTSEPLILDDFYFFNDNGACAGNGQAIILSGIYASTGSSATNFEIDGNSSTFGDAFGNASCVAISKQCNPIDAIVGPQGGWHLDVKYGSIHDMAYYSYSSTDINIQYSWIEGWCKRAPTCHSEWFDGVTTGTIPNIILDHSTVVGQKFQSQFGPVPLFFSSTWGTPLTNLVINDVTEINGFAGGINAPSTVVSGCLGMPPSGGTAVGPTCQAGAGNLFYQTSPTLGVIGQGDNLNCTGASGNLFAFIPGPYSNPGGGVPNIVGEWSVDGQAFPQYSTGTLAGGGGSFGFNSTACTSGLIASLGSLVGGSGYTSAGTFPLTGGTGTGATVAVTLLSGAVNTAAISAKGTGYTAGDVLSAAIPGGTGFSVQAATISNTVVNAFPGTDGIVSGHGPTPATNETITNNFIDASSQGGGGLYVTGGTQPTSLFAAISGTNMLASGAISLDTGEIIYSPSIASCGTTLLSCPAVVTGLTTGATGATVNGSAINQTITALVGYDIESTLAGASVSGMALTTTTSPTLTVGDFLYDPTITGCTGSPAGCPKIASGSGNSWVLTASGGTVGPLTLHTVRQLDSFTGTINNANPASLGAGNILLDTPTNTQLVYAAALPPGWPSAAFGPYIGANCTPSTDTLACPQLLTPIPNTVFTLSVSGGTVGGTNSFVNTSVYYPGWCLTPATMTGNVDMAHLLSDTFMNTMINDSVTKVSKPC